MKCSVKNVCLGKNRREKWGERKWEENKGRKEEKMLKEMEFATLINILVLEGCLAPLNGDD